MESKIFSYEFDEYEQYARMRDIEIDQREQTLPEHDVCSMPHEQHWMYYRQTMVKHYENVAEMLDLVVVVKPNVVNEV